MGPFLMIRLVSNFFPLYTTLCFQMAYKSFSREIRICCNTNFAFSKVKGLPKTGNMNHNLPANKGLKLEIQLGRNAIP